MKNLRKGALFLSLAFLLGSCTSAGNVPIQYDDDDMDLPWVDYNIPAKEVNFANSEKNITLYRNDASRNTHTYTYEVLPKNATNQKLNFTSTNEEIVTVEGDTVTAVGAGTTTVVARVKDEEPKVNPISLNVTVEVLLEDFSVTPNENIVLDYNQSLTFGATFTPGDATDKNLTYAVEDESLLDVSGNTITAKEKEGTTKVTVTHASGLTKEVSVEVKDLTVHVESVDLAFENNLDNIEINTDTKLIATVHPDNATHKDEITYHVEDRNIARVSSDGVVTGLNKGTTKVYAMCEGVESTHIDLTVYEVFATAISFGLDEIDLDNVNTPKRELSWTYTTDILGKNKPSKEDVTFSSDNECVRVSETGLVEAVSSGSANVTISILGKDGNPVTDTIKVNVTILATAVSFNSSVTEMYKDEDLDLTVSVTPSGTTVENVTFEVAQEPANIATYEVDGNKISLHSAELGKVTITASHSGISATKEINIIERPVYFEANTDYVVGTADFSSGVSQGDEESWGNARLAYKMSEKEYTGEGKEDLEIQTYAQITFRAGDEFVIFNGTTEWVDVYKDNANHYHKDTDDDAFTKGLMSFEGTSVHVDVPGTYDIYHKLWKSGWHEVYIDVKPSLNVDKNSLTIQTGNLSVINAHEWTGDLHAVIEDTEIANVKQMIAGKITVEGIKAGTTKLVVSDDLNEIKVPVTVQDEVVPTTKTIYLNANGMFDTDGVKPYVHAWLNEDGVNNHVDLEMSLVEGQTIIYSVEIPLNYDMIIFCRMPSDTTTFSWDTYYNKTIDEALTDKDMWKMTGYSDLKDDNEKTLLTGEWSTFDPSVIYTADGDDPIVPPGPVTNRTIYINANGILDEASAVPFIHAWGGASADADVKMTLVDGQTIVYSAEIPSDATQVVFVRMPAGSTSIIWDGEGAYWNKSGDLDLDANNDMWTVTGYEEGIMVGTWSVFDPNTTYSTGGGDPIVPPDPVDPTSGTITVYFAGVENWGDMKEVHMSLTGEKASYVSATKESDGRWKVTFSVSEDSSTLHLYFVNTSNQYRHPACGASNWDTDYSTIDLTSVTKLSVDHSYAVTWTGWEKNYDNWEHAWFTYTVTELAA